MRLRPRPGQPRAVFAAIRLMWAGAAAELAALIIIIVTADAARFAFTSLFLLLTMRVIIAQAQGAGQDAPADMIAATVAWFVALVSVVLIFVPASNRYFRQMAAPTAG
jgi:hypothetical protein